MNNSFEKSAIALVVATFVSSGAAWAQDTFATNVSLTKHLTLTKNLTINGTISQTGTIGVNSSSVAVVNNSQSSTHNESDDNYDLPNRSTVGSYAMNGAKGNIGLNAAAGDNNLQDNATAVSATAEGFTAGLMDAEVFVRQNAAANTTTNNTVTNVSTIDAFAFNGASGNIGVNVTTGNNNLQKNNVAMSVGNGVLAEASVDSGQTVSYNDTDYIANTGNANTVALNSSAFTGAVGNIGVNMSAGSNNLQSNSLAMSVTRTDLGLPH